MSNELTPSNSWTANTLKRMALILDSKAADTSGAAYQSGGVKSMSSTVNYEMRKNGPPSMAWFDYEKWLRSEWDSLLRKSGLDESSVQKFIEEHICLVPSPEFPLTHGGGSCLAECVVTQPTLAGFKKKIPDFLFFAGDSGEIRAYLIEIESPNKRWYNKDGTPTSDFTQAVSQLKDWQVWFDDPSHMMQFEMQYEVRESPLRHRSFTQKYILLYGRRSEIESKSLNRKRTKQQGPNEIHMTYGRIEPNLRFENAPTVVLDCSGVDPVFRAIHVPPTFRIGPAQAHRLSKVVDLDVAVKNNLLMSEDRKRFLVERLDYWRQWSQSNEGIIRYSASDLWGE